jgi:hypothetical protein
MHGYVQSAGAIFGHEMRCEPSGEGFECALSLAPGELLPATHKALTSLMREYVRESGWKTTRLSLKRHYIALGISPSRAASSTSKNL